jgi:hypothetical protein
VALGFHDRNYDAGRQIDQRYQSTTLSKRNISQNHRAIQANDKTTPSEMTAKGHE